MTEPDRKTLKVKMRGRHGCAKTEMLIAIERIAKSFGMTTALEADGHNMAITSTKAQRVALHEFNHHQPGAVDGRRALLSDGDVA